MEGMHTIVEAGTGVGKSLAYLVPAFRSGKKVVLSTGTIALQEQLVHKDIPLVERRSGLPLRVTLLKGRSALSLPAEARRVARGSAARAVAFDAGDLGLGRADADRRSRRASLRAAADEWEQLDADADECVGEYCAHFRDCFFFKKRDEAKYADLVVVNHALFFLDLAVGGGLLAALRCRRPRRGASMRALGNRCAYRDALGGEHRANAAQTPSGLRAAGIFRREFDEGVEALESSLARGPRRSLSAAANEDTWPALDRCATCSTGSRTGCSQTGLAHGSERVESDAEAERRRDLALRAVVAHAVVIDRVEPRARRDDRLGGAQRRDARYAVNCAPYEVAEFLRVTLFSRTPSVVLTSATLSTDSSFEFARRTLGIDDAQELIAPSPFDYARQARLFVAPPRLNPKSPRFCAACGAARRGVSGSHAAAALSSSSPPTRACAKSMRLLRERLAFPVRLQGDLPRAHLLDWFRRTPGAVLFATGTFWEGIDVVGDALSCVIIDRLPFPSPSDPLVMARVRALEARGLDGFEHYMVPAATVRLKQGFGRLIRSGTDRGLVALLDGRAASTRYGATILSALPPATRIEHLDDLTPFFAYEKSRSTLRDAARRDDRAVHEREPIHSMALGQIEHRQCAVRDGLAEHRLLAVVHPRNRNGFETSRNDDHVPRSVGAYIDGAVRAPSACR